MISRLAEYTLILVIVPAVSLLAGVVLLQLGYATIGAHTWPSLYSRKSDYDIFAPSLVLFACAWFCGWFAAWKTGDIKMNAATPILLGAIFCAVAFLLFISPRPHPPIGHSGLQWSWSEALFAALAGHGRFHWSEGLTLLIAALAGPFLGARFRERQQAKHLER